MRHSFSRREKLFSIPLHMFSATRLLCVGAEESGCSAVEEMLVSTRIVVQYASKRVVKRDWRVVVVPDEDASSGATVLSLFQGIVDHSSIPQSPSSYHQRIRTVLYKLKLEKYRIAFRMFH